jgi:hypothetical protein
VEISWLIPWLFLPIVWYFRRKLIFPKIILSNLDNIIVEHKSSGKVIWTYSFLTRGRSVILPPGFIAMIKFFQKEMQKAGLGRFEKSILGTFIKEDGEHLSVTCISGNRRYAEPAEEKWIYDRMSEFISLIEKELNRESNLSRGNITESNTIKRRLPELLGSIINLQYAENKEQIRFYMLRKRRLRLKEKLETTNKNLKELSERLEKGKIDHPKYEERKKILERSYKDIRTEFMYTILLLSRTPPDPERLIDQHTVEEVELLKKRFYELWLEINEAPKKETIVSGEMENKQKEQELFKLIKTLDRYMDEYLEPIPPSKLYYELYISFMELDKNML